MDTIDAILTRQSVRSYKPEQIPTHELNVMLEAGMSGPGSGTIQFTVIQNPELLKKINDTTKAAMLNSGIEFSVKRASTPGYEPVYGAPTMIILSSGDPNGVANASCAAENLLIAATAFGLGSCYLMSIRGAFAGDGGAQLMKDCGIPEGYTICCAVITGYQDGDAFKSPAQKVRTVNYVK